jgi:hypothetical protein
VLGTSAEKLARARQLIAEAQLPAHDTPLADTPPDMLDHPCPHCGSPMAIIEMFGAGVSSRLLPSSPPSQIPITTS